MKEIEIKSVFRIYGMDELQREDRQLVEAAMEATKCQDHNQPEIPLLKLL